MNDENGTMSGMFEGTKCEIKSEEAVNQMLDEIKKVGFKVYPDTAEMKAVEIGEKFEDKIKQIPGQNMIDSKMKQSERKKTVGEEIPDLDETVSMMNADNFEDRMRAEYWQLRIRRMKLERQMDRLIHKHELLDEIDEAQKGLTIQLMRQQIVLMGHYAEVLIKRATMCGIDLCAGDAESIAERCVMADKHRQEAHDLNGREKEGW